MGGKSSYVRQVRRCLNFECEMGCLVLMVARCFLIDQGRTLGGVCGAIYPTFRYASVTQARWVSNVG